MDVAKFIDWLVVAPELTFSFNDNGMPMWKIKDALTRNPMRGRRGKLDDSDKKLIKILKLNPGMELQLSRSYGMFPYFAIHTNSHKEIRLPKGMFLFRGCVCYWKRGLIRLATLKL